MTTENKREEKKNTCPHCGHENSLMKRAQWFEDMGDEKRAEEKILTLLLTLLLDELRRAEEKHPEWPKDDIHAAAIVAEEAVELIRASLQSVYESGHDAEMFKEAVQTGAMSIRFLKNLLKRERP